jgi:MYXO-CTERM domain-containing protein
LLGGLVLVAGELVPRLAAADPSVWVIDDGEKIQRDATNTVFERGEQNPIWSPGEPARLFALRNETIALQVVVEADDSPLDAVTVELAELATPSNATLAGGIERFVAHFVLVRRASGGKTPGESLGWEAGSGPRPATVGLVPDALIPVDAAPAFSPYPMHIAPRSNGIVWIDVSVGPDQAPGTYRGTIAVRSSPLPSGVRHSVSARRALATIPVELEVVDAVLADRPVATAVYYDAQDLARRVGPGAEPQLWSLLHAHRIAPLHEATSPTDVDRQLAALDGSLYTPERGYLGPARGVGDGVLAIGAYGALGAPNAAALARVAAVADRIAARGLFDTTEVVLYAADEDCSSPWGAGWRALLQGSDDPSVRRVRVAWTCSEDPAEQPVDVPILFAAYDPVRAGAARARGKQTWVYNGVLPRTGSFLLDDDAVSPRVNGWLSGVYDIPRWFYWESTHWTAEHGRIAVDPFAYPEFRNDDGDWANGDGVLLYPGAQKDAFVEHSIGLEGVLPSIRLKNWRRGIEDAGYLRMARQRDREHAEAVARRLLPAAFAEAKTGKPAAWSPRGQAFFEARRALLAIALGRTPLARGLGTAPAVDGAEAAGPADPGATGAGAVLLVVAGLALVRRRRPRSVSTERHRPSVVDGLGRGERPSRWL